MESITMEFQVKNITKRFGEKYLFRDFTIRFTEGIITCILGPSGCGKTTLLNIIGKIIAPDAGELAGIENKRFSYIFQEPRLLPWKTVGANIEFVLDREIPAEERKQKTEKLIRQVELEGFAGYYPAQLSGGMRQRVSIARAFACPSDIILMDEPLSGLDIKLKKNMIGWFSQIWQTDRRTVIFVTHDVDEALLLGNEIIILNHVPVEVEAREKIDEQVGTRNLEDPKLKALKQVLLNALAK